jgi:ubiquinone/menaquinone biosynthesis C-methylase UbiE
MTRFTDQTYLREEQYKTPSNLTARADLHKRFSTAPGSWQQWVMDQLALRPGERVLEVGGGPGWLWRENVQRLPAGVRICFSDFSLGMVQNARTGLQGIPGLDFANIDVQALPLAGGVFDVVIANYMVHHVPNLPRAVRELERVLAVGGWLCAVTTRCG